MPISLKGFCVGNNICINKNIADKSKFWVLLHELEHIKLGALYTIDSSERKVKICERKVNDAIIKKYNLDYLVYIFLRNGYGKYDICDTFDLDSEIYDATIDYIKRKGVYYG